MKKQEPVLYLTVDQIKKDIQPFVNPSKGLTEGPARASQLN